jgi:hypothetical protein
MLTFLVQSIVLAVTSGLSAVMVLIVLGVLYCPQQGCQLFYGTFGKATLFVAALSPVPARAAFLGSLGWNICLPKRIFHKVTRVLGAMGRYRASQWKAGEWLRECRGRQGKGEDWCFWSPFSNEGCVDCEQSWSSCREHQVVELIKPCSTWML